MVTNAALDVLKGVITFVFGLFPNLPVPSWLSSIGAAIATVSSSLSGSSAFVPWNYLFLGIGVVLAAYGVAVGIRGFRIAASFLTLGGGS